ncbi:hypothetical protein MAMC_01264 [Methylacidimicrobium cyclopophantes]|uniref:Uncharacterized protein n=1 Tax=Methylacidimicrobium cyclopophantes TaxID=1041766 RepID=A0A5E6MEM0_9BACT|nr:hypothetical protein [Methylacidimicrobium cyclopophantes]VVM06806.1 hypothetical protein MAMC_01264 [Methylacidimicrobium cyclopophantes]
MRLTQITSAQLSEIARLVQEKEGLLKKVSEINRRLQYLPAEGRRRSRGGTTATRGRIPGKAGRHPGKLKAAVLDALEEAGSQGLSVKELSAKLGVKANNLYSWFYTTGKKVANLVKGGDGRYIYTPAQMEKTDHDATSGT